jgi:hypothetical protein
MSGPGQTPAYNARAFVSGRKHLCNLPNLFPSSNMADGANWPVTGSPAPPTVTGGQIGPTGGTDAILLTAGGNIDGTGATYNLVETNSLPLANGTYTFSCQIKGGTSRVASLFINDGTNTTIAQVNLSGGWSLYSTTITIVANPLVQIGWYKTIASTGQTIYLARPMLNTGTSACNFKVKP